MQTFAKNKIALAVGASLLVMAGAAQAAGTNPTVRTGGIVATGMTTTQARDLFGTTGYNGTITITVYLKPLADTVTAADSQAITDAGFLVNGQAAAGVGSANANNDFTVTYGATPVFFPVSAVGFTPNTPVGGTAAIVANGAAAYAKATFTIAKVAADANGAFRMNGANLEYTQNNTASPIVWSVVNVQGLTAGANPITTTDSAGAPAVTFTSAAAPAVLGVAPLEKMTTHSSASVNSGFTIDGLTINTYAPIATLTKTTNFTVAGVPVGTTGCAGSTVTAADITAAATGAVAATGLNTVLFATPATATWTALPANDAAAYSTNCFNTGVSGTAVPFAVTLVGGAEPAYTNIVVPASGAAAKMAALAGNAAITDGAAPVLVSAVTDTVGQAAGTTKLALTFSEPLTYIEGAGTTADGGGQDLREVAENVKLGADALAALNLNAGGTLAVPVITTTAGGQGVLTITGIQTTDITGKTVTVGQGISVKESNDSGYVAATAKLDDGNTTLSGGVTTGASEFLSSAATQTTATPLAIAFNSADTSASAATTVADATKVGVITVKFVAGKEVVLNAAAPAKTVADLAADLVVTVQGLAGQTPVTWQFHPAAADLGGSVVSAAGGDTLTITLPTALIYSKIDPGALTGIRIGYLNTAQLNIPVANVLVAKVATSTNVSSVMANAFDGEPVILPLSAQATSSDLLTQSISGTLSGASNGSLVHAHLAKWSDTGTAGTATFSVSNGRVTNPGDKVATDLAIQYSPTGLGQQIVLQNAIATTLNAVAAAKAAVPGVASAVPEVKAAPIPVYIQIIRSSDVQANTKGKQNYQEARAILSTLASDAFFYGNNASGGPAGATDVNPVYYALLDPITGAITGRLTGQVSIKRTAGSASGVGLTVVTTDVAQGLVDSAGKFNLIVATEPSTADLVKNKTDQFLILVHEDQTNARKFTQLTSANPDAANYLPFEPNLLSLSGTRTILGVAGNAAKFVPTVAVPTPGPTNNILLSNQKVVTLKQSTAWQLFNMGAPAGNVAGNTSVRAFVGIESDGKLAGDGTPKSYWVNDTVDTDATDMAFAMAGNKVGVATETLTGTLSTLQALNHFVQGAATLAFKDGNATTANKTLTWAQGPAPVGGIKVGQGWSLTTVPTAGLTAANIEAVLKVGAQSGGDVTWFKADTGNGALTQFTAGTPVFVFSPKGGAL